MHILTSVTIKSAVRVTLEGDGPHTEMWIDHAGEDGRLLLKWPDLDTAERVARKMLDHVESRRAKDAALATTGEG